MCSRPAIWVTPDFASEMTEDKGERDVQQETNKSHQEFYTQQSYPLKMKVK